ncbi:MAG: hypothetical protein IPJ28_23635 [Betaproteobacteria bacterium]|nr:hypothetical protein [Betaproteobacteria bacterium]
MRPPSRLGNISTRMQVLTGNDVLIGGFIIQGAAAKRVVVRARGPSLVPFGTANAIANPRLELYSGPDGDTSPERRRGAAGTARRCRRRASRRRRARRKRRFSPR